jgi:L-ascorbate metabolism protein UlaG (beta-lactamase superfamily)
VGVGLPLGTADALLFWETKVMDELSATCPWASNRLPLVLVLLGLFLPGSGVSAQTGTVEIHRGSRADVEQQLHREIAPGEAIVWYLGHSGWAIRTQNHFLIFDYWDWDPLPSGASLANGRIVPEEIQNQNVFVFVSHEHLDHYDPTVLQWEESLDRITYLFGWEAGLSPEHIEFGSERDTVQIGDMEVFSVHHDFDGIPEAAFLVRVDGLSIYHSGDHGNGRGPLRPRFVSNMEYLSELTAETDLMFIPLFGWERHQVDALNPHLLFPMHRRDAEETFLELVEQAESEGWQLPIACAETRGDWLLYRHGRTH